MMCGCLSILLSVHILDCVFCQLSIFQHMCQPEALSGRRVSTLFQTPSSGSGKQERPTNKETLLEQYNPYFSQQQNKNKIKIKLN